jgi:hypothetical protein
VTIIEFTMGKKELKRKVTEVELRKKAKDNLLRLIQNIRARCGVENDEQAEREFKNKMYNITKEAEHTGYYQLVKELRTTYRIN